MKCARLKWLFGSSSLGSSVVTEACFFLVLAGLVEVLASQLLHIYCQKSEQASKIVFYGCIYFRLLLMIFCQQLPITAVGKERMVLQYSEDMTNMHDSTCHMSGVYVLASKMTLALCMFCNVRWAKEKALKERGSMEIITDNYEVKKSMRFLLCAIDSASSMYFQG